MSTNTENVVKINPLTPEITRVTSAIFLDETTNIGICHQISRQVPDRSHQLLALVDICMRII